MTVEILPRLGGAPVRIDAAQLVVRGAGGTPLCVAGEYGPAGAVRVAHARDPDGEFDRALRAFGYGPGPTEVIVLDARQLR